MHIDRFRRGLALFALLTAVGLSGCGIVLGSQGAAELARKEFRIKANADTLNDYVNLGAASADVRVNVRRRGVVYKSAGPGASAVEIGPDGLPRLVQVDAAGFDPTAGKGYEAGPMLPDETPVQYEARVNKERAIAMEISDDARRAAELTTTTSTTTTTIKPSEACAAATAVTTSGGAFWDLDTSASFEDRRASVVALINSAIAFVQLEAPVTSDQLLAVLLPVRDQLTSLTPDRSREIGALVESASIAVGPFQDLLSSATERCFAEQNTKEQTPSGFKAPTPLEMLARYAWLS